MDVIFNPPRQRIPTRAVEPPNGRQQEGVNSSPASNRRGGEIQRERTTPPNGRLEEEGARGSPASNRRGGEIQRERTTPPNGRGEEEGARGSPDFEPPRRRYPARADEATEGWRRRRELMAMTRSDEVY